MKVVNNTHWRTDHLKAILQRVAEVELESSKRRRVIVTIDYSGRRHDSSSGHAVLGGTRCTVRLPKGAAFDTTDETRSLAEIKLRFAKVASHEFAHLRGMGHEQMPSYYRWHGNWRDYIAWVVDFALEVKPKRERKVVNVREQRYDNVIRLEKKWQSKLKLAQTKLRKLRTRRRYYERALAADVAKKEVSDAS